MVEMSKAEYHEIRKHEKAMDINENKKNVTRKQLRRKIKALCRLADDYSQVEEMLTQRVETLEAQVALWIEKQKPA